MQREHAEVLLRQMLGPVAEFRDGQWEAIDLAANQRRRVLVVQRTGWGKSLVYFLAARMLRAAGAGPTLLLSPLLSLMRNQILAAERAGIRALTIHSENPAEWPEVELALRKNTVDVLLVSPERLGNAAFREQLLPLIQGSIGMFVVDEAHCISDWGHDFRPDYRRIVRVLRLLPARVPVICTTATANDRVVRDIETQIKDLHILRGPLVRPSLKLYNIPLASQADRLAWLAHFLPRLPGSGIVYTLTVEDARRVATWLARHGLAARAYHADLEPAQRIAAEQQLLKNDVKALVATVALGMGFDKPDLGFVVHFQRPGSVVAYYQQVGRAGRAVNAAFGILLNGREDDEIQDYFIRTAFPPAEVMEEVLQQLGRAAGLTLDELGARLNYPRRTIEQALKLLVVDGAAQQEQSHFSRTANRWSDDLMRAREVTEHRRAELEEMRRYVAHPGCLMEFLARALDDPTAGPCGRCMNCTRRTERHSPPTGLVQAAAAFLREDVLVLPPRRFWPKPQLAALHRLMPQALDRFESGKPKVAIPEKLRTQEGRVLSVYGDAGWGGEVGRGKYDAGRFSDELVAAAADLIRRKWRPAPPPEWVTYVPSQRHAELVRDFARRLAVKLNLPCLTALRKRRGPAPQKTMQNSSMQLANLLEAFQVIDAEPLIAPGPAGPARPWTGAFQQLSRRVSETFGPKPALPPGPVLLVDDVVDSGWTIAFVGVLLRQRGSGPVYPFALAKASLRGS